MRKSDWVITIIGLALISVVGHILYKKEMARRHQYEMWQQQRVLIKQMDPLDEALRAGIKRVEEKDFAGAKKSLEETKKQAREFIDTLDGQLAQCQSEVERGLFQPMKAQAEKVEEEAEKVLLSEELRYGAEGLVKFESKWMKPSRVQEIEEKRFADAQRAKGLVLFEDKWVTPEERTRIKEEKYAEEQRAKGLVLYRGEWVTPEKRLQLMADARKAASAASTPATPAKTTTTTSSGFSAGDSVWVIDDFESGKVAWSAEQWSDPSQVELGTLDGSKALSLNYAGGQQQKTALAHFLRSMDITTRGKILVDIQNNGKKNVKLSIMLGADQAYETRERNIGPGTFKDVAFDIKGPVLKCATDGWQQYKFPVGKPEAVNRITLMVNSPAQMVVDNIRMAAQ